MKSLGIIAILFFTKLVMAQSFYTTCTPLPASATVTDINNYNTCIANNRASAQSSGTAAAQSFTMSGSTVVQPLGSGEQSDIYNQNVNINSATPTTALTAEQQAAMAITDTGATVALSQIMKANTEGESTYLVTAESTLTEGLSKLSLAGECASVSTSGCYNQRQELYATGAAYLLAQRQAQDQASQHQQARNIACNAKNQITTYEENCDSAIDRAFASFTGNVVSSMSGISVTVIPGVSASPLASITYDPLTGQCSPSTAPACLNLTRNANLPSAQLQQSVRQILKLKYAGTKGVTTPAQNMYSTNSDGSISIKGNSSYSKNDFSDLNKLKAKGLTDTSAQNIMKNLTPLMSATTNPAKVTKESITTQNTEETSSATTVTTEINAAVEPIHDEQDTTSAREPASLKKRFGSEFIGVANDDIFKIINRRYKSEEKDDYFY